jgi:hypothetical protein
MYRLTDTGFQLELGEEIVSVQWGPMHYGSNRDVLITSAPFLEATLAEVATFLVANSTNKKTWTTRENWLDYFGEDPGDDVIGWVPADKVADFLGYMSKKMNTDKVLCPDCTL